MGFMETYKKQIQRVCENYKMRSLHSFGSVNTARFNKDSDIDLMVDFAINAPLSILKTISI
jgi:predicted nucleotidyltransferase